MPERAIPKPARSVRRALALGLLLLIPAPAGPAGADPEAPPSEPAVEVSPAFPASPASGPARPAVDFWEQVPTSTALFVPIAAGLAVLIGVVLGPVGRPSPVFRREGGLSRALARRNPGGDA